MNNNFKDLKNLKHPCYKLIKSFLIKKSIKINIKRSKELKTFNLKKLIIKFYNSFLNKK